jgi:hypothetical protein
MTAGDFYNATASLTPVFRRASDETLDRPGFQTRDTNSGKLLFVGEAICDIKTSRHPFFRTPHFFGKDAFGRSR